MKKFRVYMSQEVIVSFDENKLPAATVFHGASSLEDFAMNLGQRYILGQISGREEWLAGFGGPTEFGLTFESKGATEEVEEIE